MYKISYFNIGDLMVTKEDSIIVKSLRDAKLAALIQCKAITDNSQLYLLKTDVIEYDVMIKGVIVGSVTIQEV